MQAWSIRQPLFVTALACVTRCFHPPPAPPRGLSHRDTFLVFIPHVSSCAPCASKLDTAPNDIEPAAATLIWPITWPSEGHANACGLAPRAQLKGARYVCVCVCVCVERAEVGAFRQARRQADAVASARARCLLCGVWARARATAASHPRSGGVTLTPPTIAACKSKFSISCAPASTTLHSETL